MLVEGLILKVLREREREEHKNKVQYLAYIMWNFLLWDSFCLCIDTV